MKDFENIAHLWLELLRKRAIRMFFLSTFLLFTASCGNDDNMMVENNSESQIDESSDPDPVASIELPKRAGDPPQTTTGVPHIQINVTRNEEVYQEMVRRIYSIEGVEELPSVIGSWRGISIVQSVEIMQPDAIIGGREFGHIHDDGSLHLFLEQSRSAEAIEACWAVLHPFAVQEREGWDGFVMLYTPLTMEELDWTFHLIVDGYNYVTGSNLVASNYH